MIDIGKRIKELLRIRGILQKDLAADMGKSKQGLSSILRRPNVDSDWIQQICQLTGIKAAEIFGESPEYPPLPISVVQEQGATYSQQANRLAEVEMDLAMARKDVAHLKKLLAEKERLITVLMKENS